MQTTQSIEVIPGVERPVFGPTDYAQETFIEAEAMNPVQQPNKLTPGQLAVVRHVHAKSYLESGLITEDAIVTDPETSLWSMNPTLDEVRGPDILHHYTYNPELPRGSYVDTAVLRGATVQDGDFRTAPQGDVFQKSPAFMNWADGQGALDATKVMGSFGNIPNQTGQRFAMHAVYREGVHHPIRSGAREAHIVKIVRGMHKHLVRYLGNRNFPELGEFKPIQADDESLMTTENAVAVPSGFVTDEFHRNTARDLSDARAHSDSAAVLALEQGLLYYSARLSPELLHEQVTEARAQIIAAHELEAA